MIEMKDIYGTYVDALMQTEAKRQSANQVYMSITLAILTAYSTLPDFASELVSLILGLVSFTWLATVLWYRALAKTKYAVVLELESTLEAQPFKREWDLLPGLAKTFGLTRLELIAPCVMLLVAAEIGFQIWGWVL